MQPVPGEEATLLAALVAAGPDPVVVLAEDGSTHLANHAARTLLGLAAGTGRTLEDALDGPSRARWRAEAGPAVARTGRWLGDMGFVTAAGAVVPVRVALVALTVGARSLIGVLARDRSAEVHLAQELAARTDHDGLTGCYTRRPLENAVGQALARLRRGGHQFAVCFIDLDGFKTVNDVMGHDAGDAVLLTVADRLRAQVRESDLVARVGGDEFVLLLADVNHNLEPDRLATRIITAISRPIATAAGEATVGASIGIYAVTEPDDNPEGILARADTAMYEAKRQGKGRVAVFGQELRERSIDRLDLAAGLRGALIEGQLEPVFRPVASVALDGVIALEASVWWRHPERGLLTLKDFIDVARDTGLIVELDRQLIETVCAHLSEWRPIAPDLRVWITLSERLVLREGFVDVLVELVDAHPEARGGLGIEIRADALGRYPTELSAALRELDGHGVLVALDDFGPCPISPLLLDALPIHTVKLHPDLTASLATSPEPPAALRAVVAMIRALGIHPQAKAVGRPEHLRRLAQLGVDQVQGSLVGRHEPAVVTGILLAAGTPPAGAQISGRCAPGSRTPSSAAGR